MSAVPAIRARGLVRRFGEVTAVDGLDLDVAVGQIYGFLGPNGSGKSTTLRLLCGLLRPSAGSVEALGWRIPAEAEQLRRRLGYMTQRFSLYEDLSVAENLEFMARIYSLPRSSLRETVESALRRYRLDGLRRQRAGALSGGERQRLALAAVTLHTPPLLLLDEPTSAVDPQSRRDFWDSLFELAAGGATLLVSTHYMDEAERCHRLAILHHGRLVAEGAPRALEADLDAVVVEVQTEQPVRARACLAGEPWLRSLTQIGERLRALLPVGLDDPAGRVVAALAAAGITAQAAAVAANLEDVFVTATQGR